ncbi:MAG: hypothetical protein Q7R94_00780 [bacterium]|nr:hypothetical protein [bacterium]
MPHQLLKKIIGILASVFIISVAYYGTFLPLKKSQSFISALRNLRSATSLQEFERILSEPLGIPSPIGQEELVRNSANVALSIVQQNNKPEIISAVVDYVEEKFAPLIARGTGMSFEQNLYILATINQLAFAKTGQANYFLAAKKYYSRGLELGPKRPQFLYGMFDVYRTEGNVEASKAIAAQILSQWPDDERTREGLQKFLDFIAAQEKATNK